jgi:mRNA turnover protein 4
VRKKFLFFAVEITLSNFSVRQSVALTKTEKRSTRDHKSAFIQHVRDAIDKHDSLYLFSYENMRSNKFKKVRLHFRNDTSTNSDEENMIQMEESRIFLGKNKLLQIALGRTPEEEYGDNLRIVAKHLVGGSVGLLVTSRAQRDVQDYFRTLTEQDFARAGSVATRDVEVTANTLKLFPVSMMEQFRKLGMPVEIKNGHVTFREGLQQYLICRDGEVLSAEKCKLLVHFDVKLTNFKVTLLCRWSNGEFEQFD